MQDFQDLAVWKRAHALVLRVYRTSKDLPQSENFGLILNLRRCAVFAATRIAEGAGRHVDAEFAVEVRKARASSYELEYLLLLVRDLGFIPRVEHDEISAELIELRKMMSGLLKRLTAGS
jgi:four helix bundle protein